ncbi:uncharacterized protein [Taeniopygia guttata]|uniref:uncharacterized protein n=1 Tax=Taeniopygia guttata TaxID=59729 RepID=UPI003BB85B3C
MVGVCQLAGCLPGSAHLQAAGLLAGKGRERAGKGPEPQRRERGGSSPPTQRCPGHKPGRHTAASAKQQPGQFTEKKSHWDLIHAVKEMAKRQETISFPAGYPQLEDTTLEDAAGLKESLTHNLFGIVLPFIGDVETLGSLLPPPPEAPQRRAEHREPLRRWQLTVANLYTERQPLLSFLLPPLRARSPSFPSPRPPPSRPRRAPGAAAAARGRPWALPARGRAPRLPRRPPIRAAAAAGCASPLAAAAVSQGPPPRRGEAGGGAAGSGRASGAGRRRRCGCAICQEPRWEGAPEPRSPGRSGAEARRRQQQQQQQHQRGQPVRAHPCPGCGCAAARSRRLRARPRLGVARLPRGEAAAPGAAPLAAGGRGQPAEERSEEDASAAAPPRPRAALSRAEPSPAASGHVFEPFVRKCGECKLALFWGEIVESGML